LWRKRSEGSKAKTHSAGFSRYGPIREASPKFLVERGTARTQQVQFPARSQNAAAL